MRVSDLRIEPVEGMGRVQLYRLLDPVSYAVNEADHWYITVPKGFVTDFASVPGPAWPIIELYGGRHKINSAAVLHDWLYATHHVCRTVADSLMYQELRETEFPRWQAKAVLLTLQKCGRPSYTSGPERLRTNCPELAERIKPAPGFERIAV